MNARFHPVFPPVWDPSTLPGEQPPACGLPPAAQVPLGLLSILLLLFLSPLTTHAQFNPRIYGSAPFQSANNGGLLSVAAGEWLSLSVYDYPFGASVEWLHNLSPIPNEHDPWLYFDEITTADAGTYAARVTINGVPLITASITVTVLPGLTILQTPPNPVVAGNSVTLTAAAPGAGELHSFVWRHRGVIVPNASSPNLVIASANIASGGPYSVSATYSALGRTVRGPRHRVDVYPALARPIIVTPPRPLLVTPNGAGLFAVGVSGTGPFTYRWQKDGVDLEDEHEFFVGGDEISPEYAGAYRVIVSNAAGSVTSDPVSLTIVAPPAFDPQATALVATGRNRLTNHTSTALADATAAFASAVNLDPNHPLANLFHGLTRLVDVIHQAPAQQFMNRLQIEATQRDVYDWTANLAERPDGTPIPPPGVDAAEFPAFARDHFLPQIQGARANLARLTDTGFTADLTAAETTLENVTVDQADLHLARAGLALLEFWVRTLNSWNLSMPLTDLDNLATQDLLTIERLLADYPALLAYADPAQVAPARAALEEAVDHYVYAAALLRTRDPNDVRLFSLEPEDLDEEAAFRQFVLDLKASLDAPTILNGTAAETPGLDDATQYQVQLGPLFDGTHSVRSLLPGFVGNQPDPVTLPDASFGNAIVSIGPPSILLPPIDRHFNAGSTVQLGVVALGAAPLQFQWYKNGTLLPNATSDSLTIPNAQAGDQARYEVHVQNLLGETWSDGAWLELNRPPRVTTTGLDGNSGFVLNFEGPAGGTWVVQWSANLQTWTDLQSFPNFSGSASIIDPVPAGRTARFYRALQR